MPEATLKFVAKLAGVAPTTVSRVVNGSENVAAGTREKILAIIRNTDYRPNIHAANLRRKRLNDESTSSSKGRLICENERLRAECNSYLNPPEEAFIFNPEEGRALSQQLIRLRRDLDRLSKHTDRIQTCLNSIQEACSRRPSSCATHNPDEILRAG